MKKINKQVNSIVKLVLSFCMLLLLIPITNINAIDDDRLIKN